VSDSSAAALTRPVARRRAGNRRRLAARTLARAAVGLLLIVEIYPIVWLVLQSFQTSSQVSLEPIWSLPNRVYLHNYEVAWTTGNIGTYFRNSVLATFPALALIIVLSLGAAFGIEVMRWRGRNVVLLAFVAGILIPMQMVLLPMFTIYFHLHL